MARPDLINLILGVGVQSPEPSKFAVRTHGSCTILKLKWAAYAAGLRQQSCNEKTNTQELPILILILILLHLLPLLLVALETRRDRYVILFALKQQLLLQLC